MSSYEGPILSRDQCRAIDRMAVQQYGLAGIVLMENAGRGVADELVHLGISGPVVVCCGKGNNGGDGFVIARQLESRGYDVLVLLWCRDEELIGDAATNFHILQKAKTTIQPGTNLSTDQLAERFSRADWIVDALLGTGARGEPRSPLDVVIGAINASGRQVAAIDVPSGLDCDTGRAASSTIRASHTFTFVAIKPGFLTSQARKYTGEIHVQDIGIPAALLKQIRKTSIEDKQ